MRRGQADVETTDLVESTQEEESGAFPGLGWHFIQKKQERVWRRSVEV